MSEITYKEKFEQLQDLLLGAFNTFYVWKALQTEENNDVYKEDGNFWSVVIPALQHEWFISLARLFEDSRFSDKGKVISVHALIKEHPNSTKVKDAKEFIQKNDRVFKNITRIRDLRHAHNNARFLVSPKGFEKKFELKYGELEEIFEFADKLLEILHPEDNYGYILDHMKDEARIHTEDIIRGLRYFFNERNKYRKRWVNGEVDGPDFPLKT
ncbi:MAG: hypothetical protein WC435_00225 [Candidatus Paceibacterota bacterium]